MKYICVFCGSSENGAVKYAAIAKEVGAAIVAAGYGLVYGGSSIGLMNIIATTVLAAGGVVKGVITPEIKAVGVTQTELSAENLFVELTYAARKAKMRELASGYIVLPGGLGTLDELAEVAIGNQFASFKNITTDAVKPCVVLNNDGFYDGLLMQYQRCCAEKFMLQDHADMVFFADNPKQAVNYIHEYAGYTPNEIRWWELS